MKSINNAKIGVIGLGYVGLPLAVEFGKKFPTVGYDINENRVKELLLGEDSTLEVTKSELMQSERLQCTSNISDLKNCNVYIVTVPTPINKNNLPDLSPLIRASEMLGEVIDKGDVVIYESTVYPGATEDDCVPVLEVKSGLKYNEDFFVGYSPERINPGDKERSVSSILKITSGSNGEVADFVDDLYQEIIVAGTHKASSIKVAEAAKVIENVQRDVNIALINELHQIFNKLGINTQEVIEAAATKWNFMKLLPGLVGGHCISVDPYYLLHKSQVGGYIPDLMRTAREINDSMSDFVVNDFLVSLVKNKIEITKARVLILGFAFKENCPDIRNTKVLDVYNKLVELGIDVEIYDPLVDSEEVKTEYGIKVNNIIDSTYDIGFLAVKHELIKDVLGNEEVEFSSGFIYDFRTN